MTSSKTASYFSASCLSIKPEIFQALIQLSQPFWIVGNGLTGLRQRSLRLIPVTHHHIGPHQPQPSLDVVTVLLQSGRETLDHAMDHRAAVGLIHVFCRGYRIV